MFSDSPTNLLLDVDLPVPPGGGEEGDQPLEDVPGVVDPLGLSILDDEAPRLEVVGVILDLFQTRPDPSRVHSLEGREPNFGYCTKALS